MFVDAFKYLFNNKEVFFCNQILSKKCNLLRSTAIISGNDQWSFCRCEFRAEIMRSISSKREVFYRAIVKLYYKTEWKDIWNLEISMCWEPCQRPCTSTGRWHQLPSLCPPVPSFHHRWPLDWLGMTFRCEAMLAIYNHTLMWQSLTLKKIIVVYGRLSTKQSINSFSKESIILTLFTNCWRILSDNT